MLRWIGRAYSNRIVNINVNVLVAGFAAISLTIIPVHLSRYFGVKDTDKTTLAIITFVSDVVLDFAIYFVLHWLANHWPRKWKKTGELVHRAQDISDAAPPPLPFLLDAGKVQLQRLALSPVLYAAAIWMQYQFLTHGVGRELAGFYGYTIAMIFCRFIHTWWLIREDRIARRKWEAQKAARGLSSRPSDPGPQGRSPAGPSPSGQSPAGQGPMNPGQPQPEPPPDPRSEPSEGGPNPGQAPSAAAPPVPAGRHR